MLSGIITAILLVLFVAGCLWAFSPKRKRDFDAAAKLPLSDEPPAARERDDRSPAHDKHKENEQ